MTKDSRDAWGRPRLPTSPRVLLLIFSCSDEDQADLRMTQDPVTAGWPVTNRVSRRPTTSRAGAFPRGAVLQPAMLESRGSLRGAAAMDPVRTASYKGHEVRVYVSFVARANVHTGMYEIYPDRKLAQRGVVAGNFTTSDEPESAALKCAQRAGSTKTFRPADDGKSTTGGGLPRQGPVERWISPGQ